MPELPEVETVRRSLLKKLVGRKITQVHVTMDKIVSPLLVDEFVEQATGKEILDIRRRGKYLLLDLSEQLTLIVHLRMTGKFIFCKAQDEVMKHTHVIFELDDGHHLRFVDQRQFGKVLLVPNEALHQVSGLSTLGPEPLEDEFTLEWFKHTMAKKSTKIKGLLLDQTFLAGLGNIYVDEALFRAKVHPERPANSLKAREVTRLYQAVRDVLQEGIEYRGTSFKDYVDGEGKTGGFQNHLKAYGRENQPCEECGTLMMRKKVAGRSSVYCPRCQRL